MGPCVLVLAAHLPLGTFLAYLSPVILDCIQRTFWSQCSALCCQVSKILRPEPSQATQTERLCLESISHWGPGPRGACFSATPAEEMCAMFHSVLYFPSALGTLRWCNIVHFEWGKCKIVFPFYLCDSLRKCFLTLCSKWFSSLYFCFDIVVLMPFVVPDSRLPRTEGREDLELPQGFCSTGAILHH